MRASKRLAKLEKEVERLRSRVNALEMAGCYIEIKLRRLGLTDSDHEDNNDRQDELIFRLLEHLRLKAEWQPPRVKCCKLVPLDDTEGAEE